MPRLLSVSKDAVLLRSRHMLLESAGHEVRSTADPREALSLAKSERFDAAVVGQSIPLEQRLSLVRSLRDLRPELPIAVLCFGGEAGSFRGLATDTETSPVDPVALLALVNRVCIASRDSSA